ncbi:MAG: DNA primase DnaG [Nanoarchaeota archaeon]|nr:DNA primase DnaG [Nanoarchaeota archaeon]
MGKISPVSAKYIVESSILIDGVVDKPDVIGAIFGQTEGLLGADLELRELQRSGRVGRIEVNLSLKTGKAGGTIIIPSSLDKEETVIIAAALETIERIGPCNAKVRITKIQDVRISKRKFVIERAKELLRKLQEEVLPDSQEITEEVSHSVRMMGITAYGKDKLPAGPTIEDSEEIIVVEGRADVLNLLKYGFKNVIALNGTSIPQTIIDLSKHKVITLFVDGDRGGDLIIKEASGVAEIDFVVKAPDGKEVEEITQKEIHKALRGKIASEQAKMDIKERRPRNTLTAKKDYDNRRKNDYHNNNRNRARSNTPIRRYSTSRAPTRTYSRNTKMTLSQDQKTKFKELLEDLVGSRGAYILDAKLNILGKVPTAELETTMKNIDTGIFAVIFDGTITKEIVGRAERTNTKFVVAMDSKIKSSPSVNLLTSKEL